MGRIFSWPMFRPLARYAEFNGRSNRAEFWLWLLFMYLVTGLFYGLMYLTSLKDGRFDLDTFLPNYFQFSPLFSLFSLGTLCPTLALEVRRLHDINRSGWWLLVLVALFVLGYILFFVINGNTLFALMMKMGEQMQGMPPGEMSNSLTILKLEWPIFQIMIPWMLGLNLASCLPLFIACALPGTSGDNRFGPAPAKG